MGEPEFSEMGLGMGMGLGLGTASPQIRVRRVKAEAEAIPEDEALFATVGELSELLGPQRCATAYQLFSPGDLPEEWEGGLVDARALMRRLLRYVGEDDQSFPLRLRDGRRAAMEDFADHLAVNLAYAGMQGTPPQAIFEIVELGDLRASFGPICVELARALVHRARAQAAATDYRVDGLPKSVSEGLPTELEGFLACFALGWGIPVVNACLDPRSVSVSLGEWNSTAWISASLNYPPDVAALLLAATHRAGARDEAFVENHREALNPSQRELYDEAMSDLEGEGPALRQVFRWGEPPRWPPAATRALEPFEFDAYDEELAAMEEDHDLRSRFANLGQPVFRARPNRAIPGLAGGAIAGIIMSFIAAPFGLPGLFSALAVVIGGVLGWFFGKGSRRSVCSAPRCGAILALEATSCPDCGGIIAGEIERTKDHLGALEALQEGGEDFALGAAPSDEEEDEEEDDEEDDEEDADGSGESA